MNLLQKPIQAALAGTFAILAIAFTAPVSAQDSLIAIGRVASNGSLTNSANTVGGIVSSSLNGTGDYTVTVNAANAFVGASTSDFVVQATVAENLDNDEVAKVYVSSVNNNQLTVLVHIDDVEDSTNTSAPEPRSWDFYFTIYHVPSGAPVSGASRFLLSTGSVNGNGTLASGTAIEGNALSTTKVGTGNYNITLTRIGGFVGDSASDYVLNLATNTSSDDEVIRGEVEATASAHSVTFKVRTDEAQDESSDNSDGDPIDQPFFFSIYRIPSGPVPGRASSNLLAALAKVSAAGALQTNASMPNGGTISSVRNSAGSYTLTLNSPGAFAGRSADEFVLNLTGDFGDSADETVMGNFAIVNDDTAEIDVYTVDVESVGLANGFLNDLGFHVVLLDAVGNVRPDLLTGLKKNPNQMVGNDIYNFGAAGQKVTLKLPGTSKRKFFFNLENDGNIVDQVNLTASGAGNKVRTKYFRTSGGRTNITAQIKAAGHVEDRIAPGRAVKFEAQVNYKNAGNRPTYKEWLHAASLYDGGREDRNRVKIAAK